MKRIFLPESPTALRFAAIMHRQPKTRWSEKEVAAFKKLLPIPEDDLAQVERYYRWNWPPDASKNILRHDLATFINNFPGEVDRARIWCEKRKAKHIPRKIIPLPKLPEDEVTPEIMHRAAAQFEQLMGRKPRI